MDKQPTPMPDASPSMRPPSPPSQGEETKKTWLWIVLGALIGVVLAVGVGLLIAYIGLGNDAASNDSTDDEVMEELNTSDDLEDDEAMESDVDDAMTSSASGSAYFGYRDLSVTVPEGWTVRQTVQRERQDVFPRHSGPAEFEVYNDASQVAANLVATVMLREKGIDGFREDIACVLPAEDDGVSISEQRMIVHEATTPNGTQYLYGIPTNVSLNDYEFNDLCASVEVNDGLSAQEEADVLALAPGLPFWDDTTYHQGQEDSDIVVEPFVVAPDGDYATDQMDTRVYQENAHLADVSLMIPSMVDLYGDGGVYYTYLNEDEDDMYYFRLQPCYACDGSSTGFFAYDSATGDTAGTDEDLSGVIHDISPDNAYFVISVDNGLAVGFDVYEFADVSEPLVSARPGGFETFSEYGSGCPIVACPASVRWGRGDGKLYYDVYEWNSEEDVSPDFGGDPLTLVEERFVLVPPLP